MKRELYEMYTGKAAYDPADNPVSFVARDIDYDRLVLLGRLDKTPPPFLQS